MSRHPPQPLRCVAALIVDDDGRIFFQRRSPQRRLFPNTWDIAGGHVEPGETLIEALYREVREETGWTVSHILAEVGDYTYTGDDGIARLETDYLVRVDGDLTRPQLEAGKHTEFRWLGADELAVLDESREVNDGLIRRIADNGFAVLRALGL
ncbi:NUDIX domain-containing protein [Solwaraspora sp. WMMB335]|uniref:NUDIX domain-containing protein n=1 Tax=Solwaraspora sp. WMMB335 TaxID=3404118 RepID=UPI003B959F4F